MRDLDLVADDMKFQNGRAFIHLGRADKARDELMEYLEVFPNGIHRHEAYLELGNLAFSRFRYSEALRLYGGLYEEFSSTPEGIEGLYRMGICYRKMGYDEDAHRIFKTLLKDYPASPFAREARIYLELSKILKQ